MWISDDEYYKSYPYNLSFQKMRKSYKSAEIYISSLILYIRSA